MPVIGHAFAGIVTAHFCEPGDRRNPRPVGPLARALWVPALVGLAYLPDVATQLGFWMGFSRAKLAGHSILLGLPVGLFIGIVWARLSGGSPRVLTALAIGSILFHDLLDLLQADRALFWPITSRVIGLHWLTFPDRLTGELLIFGLPCAIYEGRRFYLQRRSPARRVDRVSPALVWAGRGLLILFLASAVALQSARDERGRQMTLAEGLLRSRQFAAALQAAAAADRWLLWASSARIDIIRGEAYEGLGDLTRAEMFYLRAYRSDPENFWAVADLAEFYASHGTATERRQRSAPYVEELRRRFSGNRSFRAVIDRVDRAVSRFP